LSVRNGFSASSDAELRKVLKTWGAISPSIRDEAGNTKEYEKWILNRFLARGDILHANHYPIQIMEFERPDFLLRYNDIEIGIEIVVVCDEEEQKGFSKDDKSDRKLKADGKPVGIWPLEMDAEKCFGILSEAFKVQMSKKSIRLKSYNCKSCILVFYLNSSLLGGEQLEKDLIKSFRDTVENTPHKFSEIYVYKEDTVYLL